MKPRRISPVVLDVLKYLALMAVLVWLLARGTERLGYTWQGYRIPRY